MRFNGEIVCSVDDKGRIKMPASLKKSFPESDEGRFMMARDLEGCLVIYPIAEWEKKEAQLLKLNEYNLRHRAFISALTWGLTELTLDSADRFLIPKTLMKTLGNAKEVLLKGLFGKIQLWDANKYEQVNQENVTNLADLSKEVADYFDSHDEK